jgi:hypothetical protein
LVVTIHHPVLHKGLHGHPADRTGLAD